MRRSQITFGILKRCLYIEKENTPLKFLLMSYLFGTSLHSSFSISFIFVPIIPIIRINITWVHNIGAFIVPTPCLFVVLPCLVLISTPSLIR